MHYKRVERHGDVNASRREHRSKSARELDLAERRSSIPRWPESERTCNKCGKTKPIDRFAKLGGGNLRRTCQSCKAEQHRQWRAKNPQHVKEWHRQYGQDPARKKAHADRQRRYYHEQGLVNARHARTLRQYGMTVDDYNQLLAAQGGVCAMCKRKCKSGRRLAVDHCHETGRVRGLLCMNCNRAIGWLNHDPLLVRAALDYLEAV